MTTAHDNAQDARELLAAIDAWREKDKACEAADAEYSKQWTYEAWEARAETWDAWEAAASAIAPKGDVSTLAAFVALADHIDALEAKIARAMAIEPRATDNDQNCYATGQAEGYNDARDEFRDALADDASGE